MNELLSQNIYWIEKNINQGLSKCRKTGDSCELELLRILESIQLIKKELETGGKL